MFRIIIRFEHSVVVGGVLVGFVGPFSRMEEAQDWIDRNLPGEEGIADAIYTPAD